MTKNRGSKFLIVAIMVCLPIIFVALVLPIMVFPLEVAISSHVVHVGDKISGTVAIVNRSGLDVNVQSYWYQPRVYFQNIMDKYNHVEPLPIFSQVLNAGDKMAYNFEYKVTEPGIYLLDTHYTISVNGYLIWTSHYDIVIVL